jgi:phenylacetic acid degradation operon negative regulatory protein
MSAAREDRFVRSRQPRQLLLALLGDFVIDGDRRPVPARAFIEVLDAAGIAAPATRATLDRVEQRGLIARERRGREIIFSLTPTGIAVLREATARVRDPHPFHAPVGAWTFVAFSLPEELRALRSRLRSTLTWEGFAPLRDGLWVAPGEIDLSAALEAMRADLPPGTILAFLGRELPGFPMADSVRSAWDVDAIRAEHLAFIETWSAFEGDDSPSALVTRTMLVADWLALLRADPGLPRELLDDDWPADRSLTLYRELRAQTTEPAVREFSELIARRPRSRAVRT